MLAAFTFAAALLHTSGTARVARCCPPAAAVLPATEYMLRQLQPAQSIGLLAAWEKASRDLRAAGFRGPQDEAIGERALKLKQLAETLPRVKSTAMILGLCEKGSLSFETLEEPHKSQAETLSRTSLRGEPPWGSPRGHPHLAFGIAHRAGGCAHAPSLPPRPRSRNLRRPRLRNRLRLAVGGPRLDRRGAGDSSAAARTNLGYPSAPSRLSRRLHLLALVRPRPSSGSERHCSGRSPRAPQSRSAPGHSAPL